MISTKYYKGYHSNYILSEARSEDYRDFTFLKFYITRNNKIDSDSNLDQIVKFCVPAFFNKIDFRTDAKSLVKGWHIERLFLLNWIFCQF